MDITGLRKKIDLVDGKILQLLNERAVIARRIGLLKKGNNLSVHHSKREEEILTRMLKANKGPLSGRDIRKIYLLIIEACRELQRGGDQGDV